MPIYLAFSPEESGPAGASGHPLACMGYRLSPESPTLLAPSPLPAERTMMLLQDDPQPQYSPSPSLAQLIAEYAAAYHTGLICDCAQPDAPFWQALLALLDSQCDRLSLPLWVPEAYAAAAPRAWVMIGSDLTDGSFARRASRAAADFPGRCVLELRPMAARYAPPCAAEDGVPMTPEAVAQFQAAQNAPDFLSEDLLCRYCSAAGPDGFQALLFDTADTLRAKLAAAEQAGFRAAVGLLQELSVRFPKNA